MKTCYSFFMLMSLLFTMAASRTLAQEKQADYLVTGQVKEKATGESIPYATVVFVFNDSLKSKKMMACDVSGKFTMRLDTAGEYNLTVSAVGFRELTMVVVVKDPKTELENLTLDEGIEIKEVTVTAQKPLVRIEVDKLVYNMESDPESQTNNALEMLYKVPLITIDGEENISLNGQSNFKVLLNGKSSSMLSSNLKEVLKSMPAKTIRDIEVITNPSSKYDAEGVGGIINIITDKKTLNGYNGSVSAGMDTRGGYNGSLYLAAKLGKFSFSARYYGNHYKQPESSYSSNSEFFNNTDYHYSRSEGVSKYEGYSGGLSGEASFEIDTLNLISMSFWGYNGSSSNRGFSGNWFMNTAEEITRHYTNTTKSDEEYGYLSGNIDYQRTFRKPDQTFTLSYKLDNNPERTKYLNYVDGIVNYDTYNQESENTAVGREQTIQADYYDPLTERHQAEGGVKFILRQNTSDAETIRNHEEIAEGNDLDYDQYILGAYLGYVFKWKKLSTKTGLRLERTWNDGISENAGDRTDFKNRLFNLVPYITLSLMPKAGRTIKLSYTQRLSRPGIWYLNPYVNDIDSMNIRYGNPGLDAEVSHSFELGYTYFTPKLNFSATSYASVVNNSIESITRVQTNGSRVTTYENIGKDQRYGVSLYFNYRPSGKLNIYCNTGLSYTKLEANSGYSIVNEGFNYRMSFGGRWNVWKNGTANMNVGIYSPSIMLQGKSSSFYYSGIGFSQYFLKRKLMISAYANDPFSYEKRYEFDNHDATFTSQGENSYRARNFRLSLTYNFGKMDLQVKKANRGIRNDDVKGGGGSEQGSSSGGGN